MLKHLLAMILFVASSAHADSLESWSDLDKTLLATSSALIIADWAQTRYVVKNSDRYYERNQIMGTHPSMGTVNSYFMVGLAANYLIAKHYPESRTEILIAVTVAQGITVRNNRMLGIRFAF
jgi:hypothetical protein